VTVEFAVALPAVILVLAGCLSGLQVAGQQLRLQDAAADAARIVARGESASATVARLMPGATMSQSTSGDLVCISLRASAASSGPLSALTVAASSCALAGGR
jgi:Flp pilus assembly protein TadG